MAQVGRPRALDEVKRREVCALVAAGCGIEQAARYICCAPSTIRREALRNPDFHEQLRRSELSAQLSPLRAMQQAASTHWRAAAWMLERANPEQFARRDPMRLSPEELAAAFEKFFETINEEISDPALSRRVYNRLTAAIERSNYEHWAARHRRRDPAQAKRFFPAFSPEELDEADRAVRQNLEKFNKEVGRAPKRK
jgi:IS30 family transposase